jgi:hypothetical protein
MDDRQEGDNGEEGEDEDEQDSEDVVEGAKTALGRHQATND